MKIYSWNVNSLRSTEEDFINLLKTENPDIIFIQELRAHPDQISFFLKTIPGYHYLFNDSGRPGYSGTAVYYKDNLDIQELNKCEDNKKLDIEGRVIYLKVNDINFFNYYIPNGSSREDRLELKLKYHTEIYKHTKKYTDRNEKVIVLGDFNVAHTKLDAFKERPKKSLFLPEERGWFNNMLKLGLQDTYRMFNKEGGNYTWWHLGDPKREKNRGLRIDYMLASKVLNITEANIHKDIFGSDHCPISITLDL